jgi:hypothetical protein
MPNERRDDPEPASRRPAAAGQTVFFDLRAAEAMLKQTKATRLSSAGLGDELSVRQDDANGLAGAPLKGGPTSFFDHDSRVACNEFRQSKGDFVNQNKNLKQSCRHGPRT